MAELRIGSLFSGTGGLDMGVQAVLGGDVVWHSDICKVTEKGVGHYEPHRGACRLLAHRFPDIPNLGDISAVDWSQVEPVDILTGGFPCQDVSAAGKRAGIRPGTRSGLWSQFAYAISQLRPRLVVIENVRGLLSAKAHSDVEPCAWCVGDDTDGALRALGAVLGDLAGLGYDARWYGVRAADVGAPHGRFRVFVVAYPDSEGRGGIWGLDPIGRDVDGCRGADGPRPSSEPATLLPTPSVADSEGGHERRGGARGGELLLNGVAKSLALLPTPAVNDMGEGKTPEAWDGNGHGASLAIEAQRLLPTPRVKNNENRKSEGYGGEDGNFHGLMHNPGRWGDYAPAIARWESLTRPALAPTMMSSKGNPQLAPAFVEWMMGLPAGWVTDVPGLTRNDMLKLCGNGVVPQQAEAALRHLLAVQRGVA